MKSFIVSIILLSAILIAVIFNTVYISNITSDMLYMIDQLPESPNEQDSSILTELQNLWMKHSDFISVTINADYTQEVTLTIDALVSYVKTESDTEYSATRARLRDAIMRIQKIECFDLFNIL